MKKIDSTKVALALAGAISIMEGDDEGDEGTSTLYVGIQFDNDNGLFDACLDRAHAEVVCQSLRKAAVAFIERVWAEAAAETKPEGG